MKNAQVTLRDACGPLTDLLNKIVNDNSHLWLAALKKFCRKENPWPTKQVERAETKRIEFVYDELITSHSGLNLNECFDDPSFRCDRAAAELLLVDYRLGAELPTPIGCYIVRDYCLADEAFLELGGVNGALTNPSAVYLMLKWHLERKATRLLQGGENHFFVQGWHGDVWHLVCRWQGNNTDPPCWVLNAKPWSSGGYLTRDDRVFAKKPGK